MPKIELTLPEPPSVNRIWRNAKGRTYKDAKAKAYAEAVKLACFAARVGAVPFPKGTPVKYTMVWYRSRKSGDLSNRVKVVEDALNGIVWDDDSQVIEVHLYRRDDKANPRVELTIEECV